MSEFSPISQDLRKILGNNRGCQGYKRKASLSLLFNRYLYSDGIDKKSKETKADLEEAVNRKWRKEEGAIGRYLEEFQERWIKLIETTEKKKGVMLHHSNFRPTWRVVVGLGGESVLETDITLHHIYGFPYIPGSAIKGMVRSWATNWSGGECDASYVEKIFGWQATGGDEENSSQGEVIFWDAMPLQRIRLELDVMTPHYSKYYENPKEAPGDWFHPVPIPFLVCGNMSFRFVVSSKNKELADIAWEWTKKALDEIGLGAKTSSGYGYFQER